MRYLTILSTLILTSYAKLADAHPTSRSPSLLQRSNCTNAISNPSFNSETLDPWQVYKSGSWAIHEVATSHENNFYGAITNTTATSTITLAQHFDSPTGEVQCQARVVAVGDLGNVKVEAFVDGVKFAEIEMKERKGWLNITGKVSLQGDSHMVVFVGTAKAEGVTGRGFGLGIDDVKVSSC